MDDVTLVAAKRLKWLFHLKMFKVKIYRRTPSLDAIHDQYNQYR